jgi:hypothetical protein
MDYETRGDRIIVGMLLGAFVGLILGGRVGILLEKPFGFEAESLGCLVAGVGIIFGILSGFIKPIHIVFNYIRVCLVTIFFVWLMGKLGFAIGEDFGSLIWGEAGREIGSVMGTTFGVILGLMIGILNGLVIIGRNRIPIDKYQ